MRLTFIGAHFWHRLKNNTTCANVALLPMLHLQHQPFLCCYWCYPRQELCSLLVKSWRTTQLIRNSFWGCLLLRKFIVNKSFLLFSKFPLDCFLKKCCCRVYLVRTLPYLIESEISIWSSSSSSTSPSSNIEQYFQFPFTSFGCWMQFQEAPQLNFVLE